MYIFTVSITHEVDYKLTVEVSSLSFIACGVQLLELLLGMSPYTAFGTVFGSSLISQ